MNSFRRLLETCLLFLACGLARSQKAFFGDPLPAEPFDLQPFRPVVVPDWVRGTLGAGYTLSVMDRAAREKAARAGVTLSEMGFVDPFYAYYDSKLLKKRSPHVPPDRLAKDIAEYGRLRVKILGVYPPCLQSEVYEAHPDWRRVTTPDGKVPQVDLKKEPHGGMLCLLGPYGDFFIEVLAEIATVHPQVAAFSFDGLHHGGFCFCEHCRKNYLAETGKKIPAPDMENKEFRLYQHWADRRLEGLVHKMQARLKGIRKDLALITWSTNAGRWGHFLSVPRNMPARLNLLFDAPDQEFWMDESNRGNTIVPAFGNAQIWSTTNHRVAFSEPYLMSHGNPYSKDGLPAHELERRMKLVVTHGAFPSLAVAQPKRLQEAAHAVLKEIQHLKPWLVDQKPLPWAGLVVSDNTRNFYSRSAGAVEDRYLAHPLGFFRALLEEHLPFNLLQDWNLIAGDLAQYKVVMLPNTACLAPHQAEAIQGFVEAGGGLVASMEVGGFDTTGNPRPVDLMSAWLGFQHQGTMRHEETKERLDWNFERGVTADYWLKRKGIHSLALSLKTDLGGKTLAELADEEPVVFKGPALAVAPKEGAEVHAWYITPNGQRSPAILSRKIGKGRIVYLAAGIDAAYYSYAYPWQRVLLANAVRWAAGGEPPIAVTAPKCVHATYRLLPGHKRLVVHLLNDLNTTGGKARPEDDVPLREEVIPIHDIAISLAEDLGVERARLQASGKELPIVREGGRLKVVVPKLEIHQVIELEAGKKLFQEVEKPN